MSDKPDVSRGMDWTPYLNELIKMMKLAIVENRGFYPSDRDIDNLGAIRSHLSTPEHQDARGEGEVTDEQIFQFIRDVKAWEDSFSDYEPMERREGALLWEVRNRLKELGLQKQDEVDTRIDEILEHYEKQPRGNSVTMEWVEAQAEKWHDCFGIRGYFDPMEKKQYISFFETMLTEAGVEVRPDPPCPKCGCAFTKCTNNPPPQVVRQFKCEVCGFVWSEKRKKEVKP